MKQDFIKRLREYVGAIRRDIDDMRWLLEHHCGPAKEEPNAIASVRQMDAAAQQLTKGLDDFVRREGH